MALDDVNKPDFASTTANVERAIGEPLSQLPGSKQMFRTDQNSLIPQQTRKALLGLHHARSLRSRPAQQQSVEHVCRDEIYAVQWTMKEMGEALPQHWITLCRRSALPALDSFVAVDALQQGCFFEFATAKSLPHYLMYIK
ncbi:hypothetical protein ACXHXM_21420|uniref:hypothetical protein n=1 Tax=Rhizobium altiplani TaxID=1864509 RepID=UPI001FD9BEA6|nr:hypothetical protein [Rhizobium altiplani]